MGKLSHLLKALQKVAKDADFDISDRGGAISLDKIVIPKEARGQGQGSEFMRTLTDHADATGKKLVLTADGDFGGSKAGQKRLYKRFGFVDNKGRNKDFEFMENMIRNPDLSDDARRARAVRLGFDDRPVYHGTSVDFDEFDADRAIGTQFWSTTDRAAIEAGEVGAQGSGVIKELRHRIQNPAGWDEYDKFGIDELIGRGYDGLALPDGDGNVTYVAFDPSQYRSVDAAFDPAEVDSRKLMAAASPVGLAANQFIEKRAEQGSQIALNALETAAVLGSGLVGGVVGDLSRLGGALNPFMSAEESEQAAQNLTQSLTYMPDSPNPMLESVGEGLEVFEQDVQRGLDSLNADKSIPVTLYDMLPERVKLAATPLSNLVF